MAVFYCEKHRIMVTDKICERIRCKYYVFQGNSACMYPVHKSYEREFRELNKLK